MRPRHRPLLLFVLILTAAPLAASSSDAGWRADIDYLASELPRLHVNAFARLDRAEFDAEIARLRSEVPDLSDSEVRVRILRLVTRIGDAHTTVWGFEPKRVPVALSWLDGAFYVVRAGTADADLIGARLVAIDGRAADEVLAVVAAIVPHENDPWLRVMAPRHLVAPEVLYALGAGADPDRATYRFATPDGAVLERVLFAAASGSIAWSDALRPEQLPLYRRNTDRNYWFAYLERSQVLYIAYNRCQEMASQPADTFAAELIAFAAAHPVSRLVLDLRNNGGGDSSLVVRLFAGLFAALPEVNHPERFFVVIGASTFSSAMMNALSIEQQTEATLIGVPTGGKPNHYGNVKSFTLPASRLIVQYSTRWYELLPGSDPSSLEPEVEVATPAAHYFAGRDAVMERIAPPPPRVRTVGR